MIPNLLSSVMLLVACPQEPLPPAPGDPDAGLTPQLARQLGALDPSRDGWEAEDLERRLKPLLEEWAHVWEGEPHQFELPADFLWTASVSWGPASPESDGTWQMRTAQPLPAVRRWHGRAGLLEGMRDLQGEFAAAHPKIKVLESEPRDDQWRVNVLVQVPAISHRAQLDLDFALTVSRAEPLAIEAVEWTGGRHIEFAGAEPLFRDATAAVFGELPSWREQLWPSQDHWQSRLPRSLGISSMGHEGIACADVNGDGLDDLYLPQPGGLPNLLFLRQPDGSLEEAAKQAGLDFLDVSRCALLLDLDGDGDRDLVTDLFQNVVVLDNDGRGRFAKSFVFQSPETTSLTAADYDGDGDLDIYICGYVNPYDTEIAPMPYHDANNGQRNVLLRNDGALRFTEVTDVAGLNQNNRRFSFAASWEDFDRDGDPDLYVANDFGRNNLYRNDDGVFADVAAEYGVEDLSAGMGVSWGDFDRDGWPDLYVSNMFSAAGRRVTYARQFDPRGSAAPDIARHALGNSLFRNREGKGFEDVSQSSGTRLGRWAWGALFVDFDNDAREDLLVPNGFVTSKIADDL